MEDNIALVIRAHKQKRGMGSKQKNAHEHRADHTHTHTHTYVAPIGLFVRDAREVCPTARKAAC
jgi:hypothetical protein